MLNSQRSWPIFSDEWAGQVSKYADLCGASSCPTIGSLSVAITYAEISTAVGGIGALVLLNVARASDGGGKVEEVGVVLDFESSTTFSDCWSINSSERS